MSFDHGRIPWFAVRSNATRCDCRLDPSGLAKYFAQFRRIDLPSRRLIALLFLLSLMVLSGCAQTSKRANELAEQAVYKPVTYAKAALHGPRVVVVPGDIASRSFAFAQKVGENNIRDFAEIELSKANFPVQDKAGSQQFYKEIAIAANLGDQDAMRLFRAKSFPEAGYLLNSTFGVAAKPL